MNLELTDVQLAKLTDFEVFEKVRAEQPGLYVNVVTASLTLEAVNDLGGELLLSVPCQAFENDRHLSALQSCARFRPKAQQHHSILRRDSKP